MGLGHRERATERWEKRAGEREIWRYHKLQTLAKIRAEVDREVPGNRNKQVMDKESDHV